MTDVVILAGGRGTRLAPYTTVLPKPLMPVGDMPVLEILLRHLAREGFDHVNLAVGHLSDLIQAYFGDGARFGVELRYWLEPAPLGTAGPLAEIEFSSEDVLVLNGDLFTAMNFREMVDAHQSDGARATVAVLRREIPIDFGVVHFEDDDTNKVAAFDEKPVLTHDVSMGIYVFDREVIDLIPRGERFEFPDLLHLLLNRRWPVAAFHSEDFWLDIGRPDDYELAKRSFEEHRPALLGER